MILKRKNPGELIPNQAMKALFTMIPAVSASSKAGIRHPHLARNGSTFTPSSQRASSAFRRFGKNPTRIISPRTNESISSQTDRQPLHLASHPA